MAEGTPMVRGRHMKSFLELIDRQDATTRERLRAAIPPAALTAIETSTTVGWLPAQVNLEVTEAVARTLGPQAADRYFRELLLAGFEGPVLGALVRSVIALSGHNPTVGFTWVPKGFNVIFRDCGHWSTPESGPGRSVIEGAGLPAFLAQSRLWLESVASSLAAVFDVMKIPRGSVLVDRADPEQGLVRYLARWQ